MAMNEQELAERRAESKRAVERARAVLKVGDRLAVSRCGGRVINVKMTGWDGDWICSAKHNDLAAICVEKLNGQPVSFRDPAKEEERSQSDLRWFQHRAATLDRKVQDLEQSNTRLRMAYEDERARADAIMQVVEGLHRLARMCVAPSPDLYDDVPF
ncbi:hypothetical protein [Rhizorhabdus sp.]|uniref:hypothetical protein n=1 Tax=Rhizorhabdus sp. TaxID=1968843 RepID=UPI0035AF7D50